MDSTGTANRVLDLYHINSSGIYYSTSGGQWCRFNLDGVGIDEHTFTTAPQYTAIQDYIDNNRAVFHGQKSGTSGAGSLSSMKTLVNSSPNGGFYTQLPDAIHCHHDSTNADYTGLFRLHWVKPNASAGTGKGWEVIYRVEAWESSGDYSIHFLADADGTNVTNEAGSGNKITSTEGNNNSLRWFIENGRALYHGGQQDFGVKAWGKFDGTEGSGDNYNLTFSGGNVQSIVRQSTGIYKVTFINPPPDAEYSVSGSVNPSGFSGAYFGTQYMDTTYFLIELRDNTPGSGNQLKNSNRISFQVVY